MNYEQFFNAVKWEAIEPPKEKTAEPYATHHGVFGVAGIRLRCYQLSDGRRLINADDVQAIFGEIFKK